MILYKLPNWAEAAAPRARTDLETLRPDPRPGSAPAARPALPGLPRDIETICLKCLEKRPERRYAAASELAEDLGRFLDGRPVRARRATPWERAAKWARRRPSHAALVAVVATVVLGGGVDLEWARERERRHAQERGEAARAVEALRGGRPAPFGDWSCGIRR